MLRRTTMEECQRPKSPNLIGSCQLSLAWKRRKHPLGLSMTVSAKPTALLNGMRLIGGGLSLSWRAQMGVNLVGARLSWLVWTRRRNPPGSLKTVIVKMTAHRYGRRPRVGGNPQPMTSQT
jgi:hypothetical protein